MSHEVGSPGVSRPPSTTEGAAAAPDLGTPVAGVVIAALALLRMLLRATTTRPALASVSNP